MNMERHKVTRQELLSLARAQVVTTGDLAKIFGATPSHAAKLAFDLRKKGLLKLAKRGVYASVPLDVDPRGFRPDPFLAAHKALGEGYTFSHQSALSLLGGELSERKTVHVSTPNARSRRLNLGDLHVHVHSVPSGALDHATTRVRRGNEILRVTSAEKTLVDLASLPNPMQDYEADLDAFRALLPKSDPKKLLQVVQATKGVAPLARVGHLLQVTGGGSPQWTEVLQWIENALAHASPAYFATRPHDPSNRFDPEFKLVYPGGR